MVRGTEILCRHSPGGSTDKRNARTERRKALARPVLCGKEPKTSPPLHLIGTPFRLSVWQILSEIPYGKTTTYGDIAQRLAQERGLPRLSARAVGSAVGRNPISLIIPCHRVIGRNGRLTGYAGGLHRKAYLLAMERRHGDRETLDLETSDFRHLISDLGHLMSSRL